MYEEALKDGKTKMPHVKFVLLGETRHGKTSLLRLLEGEEFDPDSSSTDGIDCDLVSSKTVDRQSILPRSRGWHCSKEIAAV